MKYIKRTKKEQLVKISPAIILLLLSYILSFFLPTTGSEISAQMGILSLVITKIIFASMGFSFAFIVKEISFPYLSLESLLNDHHWPGVVFLTFWYAVCIYCFAVGG